VRGLAVCEHLQLLLAGHHDGKVLLRRLEPRTRAQQARETGDTTWRPATGGQQRQQQQQQPS
jgi:hypothetical protein